MLSASVLLVKTAGYVSQGLGPSQFLSAVPETELSRQASLCTDILMVIRMPGCLGTNDWGLVMYSSCWRKLGGAAVAVAMEKRSSQGQIGVFHQQMEGQQEKAEAMPGFHPQIAEVRKLEKLSSKVGSLESKDLAHS